VDFNLPTELPVQVPSELARRRPDIRASEALLHAATAEYGVAVARLFPQLSLGASAGGQSLSAADLFDSGSLVWGLAAGLTQPLFNRGLSAEKDAARAEIDAAAAQYRRTVLEALREVADVLRALEYDAQTLAAYRAADTAAHASLESLRGQYSQGAASYLDLLLAQEQSLRTRIQLIAAQSQRLIDTAALYQAMGGGWSDDEKDAKS
jgi:NodT family efflux transporter outer membrane factor (OMF) lipoprotein